MPKTRTSLKNGVAELILDCAPLNLFDLDTIERVEQGLEQVASWVVDKEARAFMMRAEGKVFCGGMDVHIFQNRAPSEAVALMNRLLVLGQTIERLPVPTISVVHGLNLTIGFEMSLGCDFIWAAEGARFGLVESTVGLTPGAGGTQRLVARAGFARATELVMTGSLYTAEELLAWGVVNRVLAPEQLLDSARQFSERLASGPTIAYAIAKQVLRTARDHGVAEADAMTATATGPLLQTQDLINGVESLLVNGPGKATFAGR